MRKKRKETEIFSLSFLDCICCGFGAILLLFVLTAGTRLESTDELMAKIQEVIGFMDNDIAMKDQEIVDLKLTLSWNRDENKKRDDRLDETKKMHTELDDRLKLLLQALAAIEGELGKLIDDKENMPKQEEKTPIPMVNPDKRQYLTGFDILGNNVLFLVEASGGMTANTIVEAQDFSDKPDSEKRKAPKWVRVKQALKWLIANLKDGSSYKIVFFNKDLVPLETDYGREWFDPMDNHLTVQVLNEIDDITPEGGANLEKAFRFIGEIPAEPDRVVLICDGLPTASDTYPATGQVLYDDRVAMFRAAQKALTLKVPVNIIMYPSMPDPGSVVHFWRLADDTQGALISPSENWPDI